MNGLASNLMRIICGAIVLCALLALDSVPVAAAGGEIINNERRSGSRARPVKPMYNPSTKSYFELRIDLPNPPTWATAVRHARKQIFKGVRGRLAHIEDLETHSFLQANFEVLSPTWIGLRFFCSFRKLVWADGKEWPRNEFKIWAKRWYRTDNRCGVQRISYMPVYYQPTEKGFKWQASGPQKYFVSYLVEYQTGKE